MLLAAPARQERAQEETPTVDDRYIREAAGQSGYDYDGRLKKLRSRSVRGMNWM